MKDRLNHWSVANFGLVDHVTIVLVQNFDIANKASFQKCRSNVSGTGTRARATANGTLLPTTNGPTNIAAG